MKRLFLSAVLLCCATFAQAEIDVQEVTTPGGLNAWLVEDHTIPFVALEVRFKGGASLDAPETRGATYLMTGLLEEGTGDLDARGFAREVEALAADFDFDSGDDTVSISAKFLTETKDEVLALLRGAVVAPSFPQDAIDRVRAQVLSSIASDATDPNEIVSRAFDVAAFGAHPYASAYEGTEETLKALTREDIVAAHQAALARDRLYISAVGDITAAELATFLDALLGDLPAVGADFPEDAPFNLEPGVQVVEFATPQSVALFGHPGLHRNAPDFLAAFVLNTVFGGGGFEARLMREVREKRGLTYGIYSYLVPKDYANLYLGQFSSANDRIADAIEVVKAEWAQMAEQGITQEELDEVVTYLTGAYPLRFDGNGRIANILVGMQLDNMPIDYIQTRNAQIEALTLEDINRVARELYRPEALSFVVVGQPEGL